MKKKAIEKIPYLRVKEQKGIYTAVTAYKNIAHERHLFVEIYKQDANDVPVVRIVLTKKDFSTFFPDTREWSRKKVCVSGSCSRLIWQEDTKDNKYSAWTQMEEESVLQTEKDLQRLQRFCDANVYNPRRWWEYIDEHQNSVIVRERRKRENRRCENRQKALKDRGDNTKKLPKKRILDMADRALFYSRHYLYYKKHGCRVDIACSKCGGVAEARWKLGETFEAQFERYADPKENTTGKCLLCGAVGTYKCAGKVKGSHKETKRLYLGQQYKESGLVMRYIEVEKKWILGTEFVENREEMRNACEELSGVEVARAYFEPGKKLQIDYQKHDGYRGVNFWDDCDLCGMAHIQILPGKVMQETYREMTKTMFRYSGLQEYMRAKGREADPIKYLKAYQKYPQIEMMSKFGMIGIVEQLMNGYEESVGDINTKRIDEFLGIRKERIRQLIDAKGDLYLLEAMQAEKKLGENWKREQIEQLAEAGLRAGQIQIALRCMTVQKLINRIGRYAGCKYGTGCGTAQYRLKQTAITYTDYLSMRENLGYDMHNMIYQQPHSLMAAHEKMVQESDEKAKDERLRQVEVNYPNIRMSYRKLRKTYVYEDETYLIRPARSAPEIVMEGRILHHCVGGDNYLKSHDTGKSYILMLRFKDEPDMPYITVEIDPKKQEIRQWYGAHDKKPDENNMRNWLKKYMKWLKETQITKKSA